MSLCNRLYVCMYVCRSACMYVCAHPKIHIVSVCITSPGLETTLMLIGYGSVLNRLVLWLLHELDGHL